MIRHVSAEKALTCIEDVDQRALANCEPEQLRQHLPQLRQRNALQQAQIDADDARPDAAFGAETLRRLLPFTGGTLELSGFFGGSPSSAIAQPAPRSAPSAQRLTRACHANRKAESPKP
ncbi:hypothetical protein NKH64_30295 [Mesorhizobium sp. M0999]|uniref:hypothetical protein n=1 Tax=Mesorhizobium sp. M0999 TaxID=2957045 RepID=UPI0033391B1F